MSVDELSLQRVAVVGTCGAGKTRAARTLSEALDIPHFELDNLHWKEDWTAVDSELFIDAVKNICEEERWIVDGNYGKVRNLILTRVQTVVWLDYPFWTVFARLLFRTFVRLLTQEQLHHGNREDWKQTLTSPKSILWWGISTFARRRREYEHLSTSKEHAHIRFLRFRQPRQTEVWLASLRNQKAL